MTTDDIANSATGTAPHGVNTGGSARHATQCLSEQADATTAQAAHAAQTVPEHQMTRKRRTRILVDGNPGLTAYLCASIEAQVDVSIISVPKEVLVMNQVRETAQNTLFYLGEALLTECRIVLTTMNQSGEKTTASGIGMIMGENRDRAYELAVIDAAFNLTEPLTDFQQWLQLLTAEEERLETLAEIGRRQLDATRVEFESMLTEDDLV